MDLSFEQDRSEWTTLTQSAPAKRHGRSFSVASSLAIHGIVVVILCWPKAPVFVKPNSVAHGENGGATPTSVELYVPNDLQLATASQPSLLSLPSAANKKQQKPKIRKRTNLLETENTTSSTEAGSEQGTSYYGSSSGDEVKPALPVTFQDLRIPKTDLPGGVPGDVIVEVTIDAQGAVVEEKLLQGLGPGVDERVISALRDWRFRPATRNGVAISSKHDVHFHFPS
jgi:TonB family protein